LFAGTLVFCTSVTRGKSQRTNTPPAKRITTAGTVKELASGTTGTVTLFGNLFLKIFFLIIIFLNLPKYNATQLFVNIYISLDKEIQIFGYFFEQTLAIYIQGICKTVHTL
jgi:hypothetical protein